MPATPYASCSIRSWHGVCRRRTCRPGARARPEKGGNRRQVSWPDDEVLSVARTIADLADVENTQVTDALFDLQLELEVVISTLVVPAEEWHHGLYQVLPIRQEIEREGVAA